MKFSGGGFEGNDDIPDEEENAVNDNNVVE